MSRRVHFDERNVNQAESFGQGQQSRNFRKKHARQLKSSVQNDIPDEEDQDQALYHIPGYRYPHTLTFLNTVTPEAELETMARMKISRAPVNVPTNQPDAAVSLGPYPESNPQDPGDQSWGVFIKDIVVMGFEWINQKIDMLGKNDVEAVEPPVRNILMQKDRVCCVRNGGGPKSFLPSNIYDNTSDTEEEDDEEFTAQYLGKEEEIERPPITVFGQGAVVTRTFGGGLRAQVP